MSTATTQLDENLELETPSADLSTKKVGDGQLHCVVVTPEKVVLDEVAGFIALPCFVADPATGNTADDNGHGTWVAGIIAANPDNGTGVAGITWTNKVMPVKVMNANGSGYTSDLADGIRWAVDHGASVINMSIGGYGASNLLHDAVTYAWTHDVVLVAAAGNSRSTTPSYPAAFPEVISVSATQIDDEFTNWSNYGSTINVSAPGASVLTINCNRSAVSACPYYNEYIYISGTSFATPNVAGVVALVRSRYPAMTAAQVVSRVTSTADDLGYPAGMIATAMAA